MTFLQSISAVLTTAVLFAACGAAGPPEVVTPQHMEQRLNERSPALRAAMGRKRTPLVSLDFEAFPLGRLGKGKHGEKVLVDRLRLGYVGRSKFGKTLHAANRTLRGRKALHLVDRQGGAAVYARLDLNERKGSASFDIEMHRVRPMSIALCAYEVVLTLPNQDTWRKWFADKPYTHNLVYLEGTGPGYTPAADRRTCYRPVDTGVTIEPRKTYRVTIAWDDKLKQATVIVNEKTVVDGRPYLSSIFRITESLVWSTSSFSDSGLNDNGEFYIDNIEAYADVWEKQ